AIYNILVIPAASVLARGGPVRSNRELVYREAQFYLVSVTALLLVISLAVIYNGRGLPVTSGTLITGELDRWLAAVPLLLYGLYLYIQYEEVKEKRDGQPVIDGISPGKQWFRLLVSTGAIAVGVEVLLRAALQLGDLLGTPTFLWGMTIVAAATSIP
ncbi:MAG: sodium:calcium antiporter, partial [Thermoplasmata archaeon]|nr:sodium:calcium antiporter [Thermoplasmata archaeon]NIV80740.1 sodium:calcium antiporter [Thermoplasmata archaeon]NIW84555.1 sodium:calcium antiporter [Thermoplasmata archaeon]NIW90871.1 sodium:calcium antiporter [Thermoplasmata archaeon]